MNGFAFAFVVGLIIAGVWHLFKFLSLVSSSDSSKELFDKLTEVGAEKRKQRQAYWNHGMTRRDWFWWGRW